MAITVGTNVYATLAQVDAWAAASLGADGWAAATDARKETAIRQATRLLETLVRWRGEPTSVTQALAWPRAGLTHPTTGAVVAHDTIPPEIVYATAAFADALLVDDTSGPAEEQPARIRAGSIALTFEDSRRVRRSRDTSQIYSQQNGLSLSSVITAGSRIGCDARQHPHAFHRRNEAQTCKRRIVAGGPVGRARPPACSAGCARAANLHLYAARRAD